LLTYETAGDPVSGLKWTRKTTAKIAEELGNMGIQVSPGTVAKLLKEMGFSLRANQKKLSRCSVSPQVRNEQFIYIAEQRQRFADQGAIVISIDTKKKELVGNFKNDGQVWTREAVAVDDHDFRSQAEGVAIPYGIYDTLANVGSAFIGISYDTAEFAVDCLAMWYVSEGRLRYPNTREILILADSGGSNGSTRRTWKYWLQVKFCNVFGLTVTVCHYPPGTSKWNPIEHRLFSQISKNWAGHPLVSYETVLNYIRTTTTKTGLKVSSYLNIAEYEKGQKISDKQMKELALTKHSVQPKQNYTLAPQPVELEKQCEVSCQRTGNSDSELLSEQNREVIFA
jgi:hypothetical protein